MHGDGRQTRDFTFVDSVTGVILDALQRKVSSDTPVILPSGRGRARSTSSTSWRISWAESYRSSTDLFAPATSGIRKPTRASYDSSFRIYNLSPSLMD